MYNPAGGGFNSAARRLSTAWESLTRNRNDHIVMTMKRQPRKVGAGEFKAKCLALLDEVSETGRHVLVTKRGRPVAEVVPVEETPSLEGSIVAEGDLISPIEESWTIER